MRSVYHFLILVALVTALTVMPTHLLNGQQEAGVDSPKEFAIVIHGGAGSSPDRFSKEENDRRHASMEKALELGVQILRDGGSSLDAVEKVVRFLEDDPQFNAGKGAVFNSASGHELDASIMDGRDLSCGAVAGVTTVKNPITLARKVMTETRHVLLAADGAEQFADTMGVERVKNDYFDTPRTLKAWERFQDRNRQSRREEPLLHVENGSYYGTVGCCALDKDGNLAAATSTGGLTNKRYGRVGDTPIVGAGTYANNKTCAVSCTGIGEQFMRHSIAFDLSARIDYKKMTISEAAKSILSDVLNRGDGGIIGVDRHGNIVMEFNTGGMPRAAADSDGLYEVLWHR